MSAGEKGEKLQLPLLADEAAPPQPRTRVGRWMAALPKASKDLLKILLIYIGIVYILWPGLKSVGDGIAGHGCQRHGMSEMDGYLEGLMARGWKVGAPRPVGAEAFGAKHDPHQHHHDKHEHHHGPGKHRHPHPIGPREAEEIFLATPNNVSAKA